MIENVETTSNILYTCIYLIHNILYILCIDVYFLNSERSEEAIDVLSVGKYY